MANGQRPFILENSFNSDPTTLIMVRTVEQIGGCLLLNWVLILTGVSYSQSFGPFWLESRNWTRLVQAGQGRQDTKAGHWAAQVQQQTAPGGLGCAQLGAKHYSYKMHPTNSTTSPNYSELCSCVLKCLSAVADKWCLAQGQIPTKHVCLAISSNTMTLMSTKMTKMTMSLISRSIFLTIISNTVTVLRTKIAMNVDDWMLDQLILKPPSPFHWLYLCAKY